MAAQRSAQARERAAGDDLIVLGEQGIDDEGLEIGIDAAGQVRAAGVGAEAGTEVVVHGGQDRLPVRPRVIPGEIPDIGQRGEADKTRVTVEHRFRTGGQGRQPAPRFSAPGVFEDLVGDEQAVGVGEQRALLDQVPDQGVVMRVVMVGPGEEAAVAGGLHEGPGESCFSRVIVHETEPAGFVIAERRLQPVDEQAEEGRSPAGISGRVVVLPEPDVEQPADIERARAVGLEPRAELPDGLGNARGVAPSEQDDIGPGSKGVVDRPDFVSASSRIPPVGEAEPAEVELFDERIVGQVAQGDHALSAAGAPRGSRR